MVSLYVLLMTVWISSAVVHADGPKFTDDVLASSPLIRQLLERVDALEKTGARQEDEIRQLKAEMVRQKTEMVQLRYRSSVKDRTIQQLLRKLSSSNEYMASMDENISQKDANAPLKTIETVEKRGSVEENNRIRRAENEVTIAFTAGLSTHMTQVGDHQNIIFDRVITNVGNAYNPHHGVFVAPVSGVYVFSTSILSYDSRNNWAYIAVNGVPKTELFMHDDTHAMSSQTIVLDLNHGDDVAIQGHANDAYFGQVPSFTTFTGFLLQQNFTSVGSVIG
ncbi:hypothetical protein ACF0H5_008575 [Mactra antiquata]